MEDQGPVLVNHVSGFKLKLAVGMPASREGLTLELLAFPCSAFWCYTHTWLYFFST